MHLFKYKSAIQGETEFRLNLTLGILYERYGEVVYRTAMRMLGNQHWLQFFWHSRIGFDYQTGFLSGLRMEPNLNRIDIPTDYPIYSHHSVAKE